MKTKTILLAVTVISLIGLFSFKTIGDKETSTIAIVSSVFGKGENEGFMISYADGSAEIRSFAFRTSPEKIAESVIKMGIIMGEMHAKGYRYTGQGSHSVSYTAKTEYLVFEKN